MKTSALCPISNKKINEKVARLNAVFRIAMLIIYALTQNILPVVLLGIDFLLRTSDYFKLSPIRALSQFVADNLQLKPQFINEGPKKFAARIGLVFTVIISLVFFLQAPVLALVIAGILALFSFLEGAFGFCVACEIYPFVYKLFYKDSFTVSI